MWFKIASQLSTPVYVLKNTMPFREFMQWGVFFDLENRNYSQTDINIAKILCIASKGKFKMTDVLPSDYKREQTKDQVIGNLALLRNAVKRNK